MIPDEGSILTGGRQHILDDGMVPSNDGAVTHFWKATFLDGGSIPSRAADKSGGFIISP